MTSATEEMRRLLDERGVEYTDRDMFGKHVFHWGVPLHGTMYTDAGEWTELTVENATPEQAIDAALGRGTCHDMYADDDEWFACSECNTELRVHEPFGVICSIRYCPNCGRAVVE